MSSFRMIMLASSALFLVACAAGPDFTPPDAPKVASYGPNGMPVSTVSADIELGGAQRFAPGGEVPSAWWKLFENPNLNHLMNQAIAASPSLEAAKAALISAQETASAASGSFLPTVRGSASDTRSKASGSDKPMTLYNTSVSVSYVPDVFGGTRRTNESLQALAEKKNYEVEAAYLTLTSNIAAAAIQEASLRGQLEAQKQIINAQEKQLSLIKTQFDAGAVAKTAVLAQESVVAASKTSLPTLEKNIAQTRHLLSVLTGRFPSEDVGATFTLSSFKLPKDIPVSLPSNLVKQRPDIRAALANLKAANAKIGVAMAAMLPQLTLTGSYGVGASQLSNLFSPSAALWGLAAGLTQPIFEGRKLLHEKRASEADFDSAAALYRQTVLEAFKNVADTLKALESDAQELNLRLSAERAAAASLALTQQQFDAGAINIIDLLSAQSSYQQSKVALIQAQATRLADTAALYQALGGGWWSRTTEGQKK